MDQDETARETIRVQLNYPPGVADRPIIYELVKRFDLVPDIRRGAIDMRFGGFLFLELAGTSENLQRAVAWIQECGIAVDSIGVDGAQEWAI